jgi:multiple sugar transport system permease protein
VNCYEIPPGLVPQELTFENYLQWFQDLNIQQFFFTSLIVAVATAAGNVVFCSMVGYAMAKMEFPGKKVLFVPVMVTLMVPGTVTFVPLFVLVAKLGTQSGRAPSNDPRGNGNHGFLNVDLVGAQT